MSHVEIQAYNIKTFCQAYGVSRSFVYLEFKSGRLKFFKAGRRTLISRESAERWQRLLEETGSDGHTSRSPEATQTAHIDKIQATQSPHNEGNTGETL